MKIYILAGEASGDALAGPLMQALRNNAPEAIEFRGVGGANMEKAGLESLFPMEDLAVMGIWEAIPQLPRLFRLYRRLLADIEDFQPDIMLTVDFPDFNFFLAHSLRQRGNIKAKFIHYVAPTVWAWRPWRAKSIAGFIDAMICLLPFEPPYFSAHGIKSVAVGHPIVEQGAHLGDAQEFRRKNNIPESAKVLGLFFGSRENEFKNLSETLKEAAMIVQDEFKEVHLAVPTLPHFEYDVLKILEDFNSPAYVVSDPVLKWNAYAACDGAIAVSGTVGLELAYIGIPHVIAYKMHPASWAVVQKMVKVEYAHLGNIMLNEKLVPEYLQRFCDSVEIAKGIVEIMRSPELMQKQKEGFARIRELIGGNDPETPSVKAAKFILQQAGR